MLQRGQPVLVVHSVSKRDHGRRAQLANIQASRAIADTVRTTLGPMGMLKMLFDPMGGIVITNDGNSILREISVNHPAAKAMIEISRAQDEEVGDGTTSVVLIAGELLSITESLLEKEQLHPTQIIAGYLAALEEALNLLNANAKTLDPNKPEEIEHAVQICLQTKFSPVWTELLPKLALEAAKIVCVELSNGKDIDIKKYAKVEKIPGGEIQESCVLSGVMLNKDITHPKMRRYIKNPRVVLLDCPLEYKKCESQTNVEITDESMWDKLLKEEELEIERMCKDIIQAGCDVVVTEKGVSDLAQHFLVKAGISVLRRARKSDNNRLARVTGAKIVTRTSELIQEDVGDQCGLFEIKKIGDEYYSFFIECQNPKACTIMLRGGSKDVLNEVERTLQDALNVARSLLIEPKLVPGGGAIEMELSARITQKSSTIEGVRQYPYKFVGIAFEVIPRTLAENCGVDVVRTMTKLRSLHAEKGRHASMGLDGNTGEIVDVTETGIWDAFATKQQAIKTAIEAAAMLIRIDDILSGTAKKKENNNQPSIEQNGNNGSPEGYND